jgi:hypothetical protein
MAAISFPPDLYDQLSEHLSQYPERVAFMRSPLPEDGVFRVEELRLLGRHEFDSQSDAHCEIDDAIRADVIKWAWDHDACLIEAHSHGKILMPARFSQFDITQLAEWVPHVRWRLGGRPYAALVTASREIDGLAWINGATEAIESIFVDGRAPIETTELSLDALERSK